MKDRIASNNGYLNSKSEGNATRPFKLKIIRTTAGERILRIHSLYPQKGEIVISRDHAYYFMEQVIHFVAALNKTDCEST